MLPRKRCLPDTTRLNHKRTHRECDRMHRAYRGQTDVFPVLRQGSGHKYSSLIKKTIFTSTEISSFKRVTLCIKTAFMPRPHAQQWMVNKEQTDWYFGEILAHILLFVCVLICSFCFTPFVNFFPVCFLKRVRNKVWSLNGGGGKG